MDRKRRCCGLDVRQHNCCVLVYTTLSASVVAYRGTILPGLKPKHNLLNPPGYQVLIDRIEFRFHIRDRLPLDAGLADRCGSRANKTATVSEQKSEVLTSVGAGEQRG